MSTIKIIIDNGSPFHENLKIKIQRKVKEQNRIKKNVGQMTLDPFLWRLADRKVKCQHYLYFLFFI